jgi:hypothetical protein
MEMMQIEIVVDQAGYLILSQEDGDEGQVICLHPDQVPLVCEWMMKAIGAKTETSVMTRFEN